MNASMLRRYVHMACFVLSMVSICFCNQCEKTYREDYVDINSTEVIIEKMEHVCQVHYFPLVLEYDHDYCDNLCYNVLRIDVLYSHIITDRAFQSEDGVKLAEIHVENQHVEELSSSAFASLNYLQEIHLSRNNLTNIKNGTFSIPSLETLDLSMNKIQSFSRFSLVGTSKLRLLNLSSNFLHIFEVQFPSISSSHLKLDISYNALNYVQFENITGIMESLNLSYNSLTEIKDCFPAFSVINLSNNKLKSISNISCSSTPEEISYINLGSNLLVELEKGVFDGMSKLKYLFLDQNYLTSFPTDIFAGLNSLEILNVSHNFLKQFADGTFDHLESLHSLDVSCNEISELKSGAFEKMSSLKYLYLNQNNLTSFPIGTFAGLNDLEFLNVSHNRLKVVHNGFHLKKLRFLDMSFNEISLLHYLYDNGNRRNWTLEFKGIFDEMYHLEVLNISWNHLEVLSGELEDMISLLNLDLSYNEISNVHYGSLDYLYNLVTLDLSYNQIRNIKGRLRRLTHLQDLNIEFNQLDYLDIEELYTNSQKLEKVLLNGNEFSCEDLIKILDWAGPRFEVPKGHYRFMDNIQGIRCLDKDT